MVKYIVYFILLEVCFHVLDIQDQLVILTTIENFTLFVYRSLPITVVRYTEKRKETPFDMQEEKEEKESMRKSIYVKWGTVLENFRKRLSVYPNKPDRK